MTGKHTRYTLIGAVASVTAFVALDASSAQPQAAVTQASAPMSERLAAELSKDAKRPVIVIMRNRLGGAEAARDQVPVLNELAQVQAKYMKSFRTANVVAATVSDGEFERLKANPAVERVIPDAVIMRSAPVKAAPAAPASASLIPNVIPGACPPNGKVQLEPEALQVTHTSSDDPRAATARSLGYTGKGVKVAWIAEAIDTKNPNFIRPDGKSVFDPAVGGDYQDFSSDGQGAPTGGGESFLDATAIAGQGLLTYDANGFSAQALPGPCKIRIEGMAPGVGLVGLNVFAGASFTTTSNFLQAIEYAVQTDHVDVLNESFGSNPFPDTALDATKLFNDAAVAAGVVVVVSSGDSGITSTIGSPSTAPDVISVGGSTTYRWYAQTNYALARDFATTGWLNDNITPLSSGGFNERGATVSLVAPGDLAWGSCTPNVALYADCKNFVGQPTSLLRSGGTSLSSPLTAGAAALVIEAYRKNHRGASPTPALVKQILTSTATDLGTPASEQGAGLLNAYQAVLMAQSIRTSDGAPKPSGQTLLYSTSQLNGVGAPGSTHNWEVSVTNTGSAGQLVFANGRTFGKDENVQNGTVTLNDASSLKVTDFSGAPNNYSAFKFQVKGSADRLSVSIAYPSKGSSSNLNERVRLILIDPQGRLAAHSVPQGNGNFGSVDVRDPLPGKWTGVIFGDTLAAGGTNGTIPWTAATQRFVRFGDVYPAVFYLPAGQRQTLFVRAETPSIPGDTSGSIVFTSTGTSFDPDAGIVSNSIAVTLRSLVKFDHKLTGTFSGVLTGGNGRSLNPGAGQVNYYQFNVGSNVRDITANLALTNDAANPVLAYLVSPYGDVLGYGQNSDPLSGAPSLSFSANTLNPTPGLWTLIVNFAGPVVGNETSQPYQGSIQLNGVRVTAAGLPSSAGHKLVAGTPVIVPVTITNNSAAVQSLFVDARLDGTQSLKLTDFFTGVAGAETFALPTTTEPVWLVPTQTSRVTVSQVSTLPAMFDFGPFTGDPDIPSAGPSPGPLCSTTATGTYKSVSGTVTAGLWYSLSSECGPYVTPAPAATASVSAVAQTKPFDASVVSPTGDLWLGALDPAALLDPITLNPGQSVTINVTITPTGTPGTVVRGTLYLDSLVSTNAQLSGNELAGLPYAYTIQ